MSRDGGDWRLQPKSLSNIVTDLKGKQSKSKNRDVYRAEGCIKAFGYGRLEPYYGANMRPFSR